MFDEQQFLDWLHDEQLSLRDKLLLCLAWDDCSEKTEVMIYNMAEDRGWPIFRNSQSISLLGLCGQYLESETKGYAVKVGSTWKLISKGKEHVSLMVAKLTKQSVAVAASTLRDVLESIPNDEAGRFVEEAIRDVEHESYRSAVVLSWCGAIALLRDYILRNQSLLDAFNAEAMRRNPKWKDAQIHDDFGRMKEFDFLQVLQAVCAEVSKDLKQQLENSLKFRNSCGHPNSLEIDPHMVQAHVAMLARNVFAKFI